MKKYLLLSALLALTLASHAFAQDFVPLAPIPGLTGEGSVSTIQGLPSFFNNLYKFLIGLAAVLAVIQIIRSGIELALNHGNVSELVSSKGRIAQALWGLLLILVPALVFGIINPKILDLSLSLPTITYTNNTPHASSTTAVTLDGNIKTVGTFLRTISVSGAPTLDKARELAEGALSKNGVCGNAVWASSVQASCPGYLNGKCVDGFIATGQCALQSPALFMFVELSPQVKGDRGGVVSQGTWRPVDASAFASFRGTCSLDGGQPCIDAAPIDTIPCPTLNFKTAVQNPRCAQSRITCTPAGEARDGAHLCKGPDITAP